MQTIINRSVLEELRARLRGIAYAPGDDGYDEGRQAFNSTPTSTRRSW
jgi:hypothetical protein